MLKTAIVVGMMILAGGALLGAEVPGLTLFRLADAPALAAYPEGEPETDLYVLVLPESELAVILRPLSKEEYGAFQIQAIGHQLIERQMLAAAVVLPRLDEEALSALVPEVVELIQQAVNRISGFTVFPAVASPEGGG